MKRLDKELVKTAEQILKTAGEGGRPRQASLRRAISTAYYAVFHALCRMCADAFAGTTREARETWRQVYRSVEHGFTKDRCTQGYFKKEFPQNVRKFCSIFSQLQEKRHEADYDPFARFLRSDVEEAISQAKTAISMIDKQNLELKHRRAFAAWVILRKR
ncbi:hypothetical protein [Thermopetrobacter sp. TC1]|uniref:hypothetical protein n=1 Tax=Thermopetrobacter sp. TC1 TaxID=1495045 RepID=UPI0012E09FD0|nr:hypothetical protein [Thermopetrobacter sp. TC1]